MAMTALMLPTTESRLRSSSFVILPSADRYVYTFSTLSEDILDITYGTHNIKKMELQDMASTKSRRSQGQEDKRKGCCQEIFHANCYVAQMPEIGLDQLTFFCPPLNLLLFSSHTVHVILQGNPYLISSSNDCSYWFVWRTPVACSTDRPSGGNGGGIFGTM